MTVEGVEADKESIGDRHRDAPRNKIVLPNIGILTQGSDKRRLSKGVAVRRFCRRTVVKCLKSN